MKEKPDYKAVVREADSEAKPMDSDDEPSIWDKFDEAIGSLAPETLDALPTHDPDLNASICRQHSKQHQSRSEGRHQDAADPAKMAAAQAKWDAMLRGIPKVESLSRSADDTCRPDASR